MSWTQENEWAYGTLNRAIENVDLLVLLIKVEMLSSVDISFDRMEIISY